MKSASRQQEFEFEVDYIKWKDLPINQFIGFPAFYFEGLHWTFHYYPNYAGKNSQFFSLMHLSDARSVSIGASFSLLHENRTLRATLNNSFHTFNGNNAGYGAMVGDYKVEDFMGREGTFIIVCTIQVFRNTVDTSAGGLQGYLGNLLHKSETSDVTFVVEGEKICAHKLILASKSPVFEATFFGPMAEADMKCIRIEEMKADVFKAMLSFMYTDRIVSDGSVNISSMPTEWVLNLLATADRYGIEKLKGICKAVLGSVNLSTMPTEWVLDLLAAADRYSIEKLKCMCEAKLGENLSVETVSITLVLADQYRCLLLKEMCLQFALVPQNLKRLMFDHEYVHMMCHYPLLAAELRAKANSLSLL